ncbi:glycerol-3-phosphate 1-O-acyltransferase PlsY [Bacteroides heparinolyticus]|uniref:glycerol-3-phosphate 1-O-acyltransferase PlsY n=1 Tax=Prevotella heparinolytica TaxID=28113 RepID=UPI0035A1128D
MGNVVIGGADGPTAIFIRGGASFVIENPIFLIAIGIAVFVISYFLGNISPAILIGRAYGIDIKKEGSGNAGTTNVMRVLGKKAAVGTLIIDIGKGIVAVLLGKLAGYLYAVRSLGLTDEESIHWLMMILAMGCAFFVFIGHIWPLLFGFKGGKGVATAFGALVTINLMMGLMCLLVVAVVVLIFRMSSLGSICGALSLPIIATFVEPVFVPMGSLMAIIVIIKHRSNIKRILRHEESKLF